MIDLLVREKMARVCSAGLISALASAGFDHAYADAPFNFSPFSSSPSPQGSSESPPPTSSQASAAVVANAEPPRVRNDNPRTTSAGFDPEALERGAKALREINSSSHAKKVYNFITSLLCYTRDWPFAFPLMLASWWFRYLR